MTSYYTLEPGAAVRASDGTEIGKVQHVLAARSVISAGSGTPRATSSTAS